MSSHANHRGKPAAPANGRGLANGHGHPGSNGNHHGPNGSHHGALAPVNHFLEWLSCHATAWTGSSWALATAVALIVIWAACGPLFGFSDLWQLTINTGTTIVTFLMVFLIQRAQNKESLAVQIKLNELLASQKGASNRLINVEDLSEDDIRDLHARFATLAERLGQAADDGDSHSVSEAAAALDEALDEKDAAAQRRRA